MTHNTKNTLECSRKNFYPPFHTSAVILIRNAVSYDWWPCLCKGPLSDQLPAGVIRWICRPILVSIPVASDPCQIVARQKTPRELRMGRCAASICDALNILACNCLTLSTMLGYGVNRIMNPENVKWKSGPIIP